MDIRISREDRNIDISGDMSVYHLPIASSTTLGGIKVGNNLTIEEDGTLNAESTEYQLPTASSTTLGGVKVGSNLNITDGVLTAIVDNSLSTVSTNPVRNSVITNTINSTNSDVAALDTRLDTAEDNISTNAGNITTISGDLSDLSGDVTSLSTNVGTLSDTVSDLSLTVGGYTSDISDLQDRMSTAEDSITDLQDDVNPLKTIVDISVEYTSLLPITTWTSGELTLHRRGQLGFLFINLDGALLLGANSSTQIYQLQTPANIPLYTTSATVLTDVGNIVFEVTDQGEVNLKNPSASSLTISKVYGNVPVVY